MGTVSRTESPLRALGLLGLLGLLAAGGCVPTCQTTCEKALACGLDSPRTSLDACVDDCERQRTLYKDWWEDGQKVEAFAEHRQCVMQATCAELDEGVCYDPELWIFAESS